VVEFLIKQPQLRHLVDTKNQSGETATHMAASTGMTDVVKLLVESGAKVNAKNMEWETPLHLAAECGAEELVTYLISMGADVNSGHAPTSQHTNQRRQRKLKGERPIHLAAEKGYLGVVTTLLTASAAVNVRTIEGDTPLHLAAERGYEEVVMVLILCGANLNARNEEEGGTALHYAAMDSRVNVVKQLTAEGASKEIRSKDLPPVVGDDKSAILLPSKTPLEAAVGQLAYYEKLASDDIVFEDLGETKEDMMSRQSAVVAHLQAFNPMSLFWTRQSHWRCLPWAREAVFTVLLIGERLWRKQGEDEEEAEEGAGAGGGATIRLDGTETGGGAEEVKEAEGVEALWLPIEIWQFILSFLRRKELSSLRSRVAGATANFGGSSNEDDGNGNAMLIGVENLLTKVLGNDGGGGIK